MSGFSGEWVQPRHDWDPLLLAQGHVDSRATREVEPFLWRGKQAESNREHVIAYVGNNVYGIKWRNYKMMTKEVDRAFADPTRSYGVPFLYDLHTDPKEKHPLHSQWYHSGWIRWPAGQYVVEHVVSLKQEPPIRPGTPDPYVPKRQ